MPIQLHVNSLIILLKTIHVGFSVIMSGLRLFEDLYCFPLPGNGSRIGKFLIIKKPF